MSDILESYVRSMYNNVILRDSNNQPSFFVRHPKVNSRMFDASLPDSPHPAFKCGADVDNGVLIGKYHSTRLNGVLYSLPNAVPIKSTATYTTDVLLSMARTEQWVPMTIYDYGLIILLAQYYGFQGKHGNNLWGGDLSLGGIWNPNGVTHTAGNKVQYNGWQYLVLETKKSNAAENPENAPYLYKRLGRTGGISVISDAYQSNRTYTGSGPLSWYFLEDINMEADIAGNECDLLAGFRIVGANGGELQFIPNAADPISDITDTSTEWKAILPHNNDNGYDFVEPGTSGTVKYAWINNKVTLIARDRNAETETNSNAQNTTLYNIQVESASLPYVPSILYECALAPIPGITSEHQVYGNYSIPLSTGKYYARFGRSFGSNAYGLGSLSLSVTWTQQNGYNGIRQRARELAT